MQLIQPPSCLKTFTEEALETMSPASESAHVGREPWAFSSHPEISDFTASWDGTSEGRGFDSCGEYSGIFPPTMPISFSKWHDLLFKNHQA